MLTFKDYLQAHYSPTVHKAFLGLVKRFTALVPHAIAANFNDIIQYLSLQQQQGKKQRTIVNELCIIKTYYNYLQRTGQRTDHPCKDIYWKGKQQRQIMVDLLYNTETLEKYLHNHKAFFELHQQRDLALIGLLIYQALTNKELVQLTIHDIDLQNATVYCKGTINTASRTLHLQASQIMALHQYITYDRPILLKRSTIQTDILFLSHLGKPMNRNSLGWLLNHDKKIKLNIYKIRQSVICNLLKAHNDVRIVQVFAGHKHISSTEAYKQSGLEALKTAIEKYHPLK